MTVDVESIIPMGTLISQGAEGRLYLSTFHGQPCVVKERFEKKYRHPELDKKITRERLNAEAKCMERCQQFGVNSPKVLKKDNKTNTIHMERIYGVTIKEWLLRNPPEKEMNYVASIVGNAIAKLHSHGMVHGDLTTSNMMIRGYPHFQKNDDLVTTVPLNADSDEVKLLDSIDDSDCSRSFALSSFVADEEVVPLDAFHYPGSFSNAFVRVDLVMIDFGLSSNNSTVEDKGVDLYVLERALQSIHSHLAEKFMSMILKRYLSSLSQKDAVAIKARFEKVRLRGRKRVAFG